MRRIHILFVLILIILGCVGAILFKEYIYYRAVPDLDPAKALLNKIASQPKDILQFQAEIEKLASSSAGLSTRINLSNCLAETPIVKIHKDETAIVKNITNKTIDLKLSDQELSIKNGDSFHTSLLKPGSYLFECSYDKDLVSKWLPKRGGVLFVEDSLMPTHQAYLDVLDDLTKKRVEEGIDPTLAENLRIYSMHELQSKEFANVLDWVKNNAQERTEIVLNKCQSDPPLIKITTQQFTITNNDSTEIYFLGGFVTPVGVLKIPAKQSSVQNKKYFGSVLTYSCNYPNKEGVGAGFIYFE